MITILIWMGPKLIFGKQSFPAAQVEPKIAACQLAIAKKR
jgi:hypothetical protein